MPVQQHAQIAIIKRDKGNQTTDNFVSVYCKLPEHQPTFKSTASCDLGFVGHKTSRLDTGNYYKAVARRALETYKSIFYV